MGCSPRGHRVGRLNDLTLRVNIVFDDFIYLLVLGFLLSSPVPHSALDSKFQNTGTRSLFLVLSPTTTIDVPCSYYWEKRRVGGLPPVTFSPEKSPL